MNSAPSPLRGTLAESMKRLMDCRDYTQLRLKEKSGVAQATISSIVRMEKGASIDTLYELAKALGVPAWTLLVPDLEPGSSHEVVQLVTLFAQAPPEARQYVLSILKREAPGK